MRGWKRSRISELKNAAGTATNLGILLRSNCEGSLPRSDLTNSDELIAHAPMMRLILAVASRLGVGNGPEDLETASPSCADHIDSFRRPKRGGCGGIHSELARRIACPTPSLRPAPPR